MTCSPVRGSDRLIPNPVVVFEVVSSGNAADDRPGNMLDCHAVPSIKRYVLIEQTRPVIISFTRQGNESRSETSLMPGGILSMPEIDIEILVVQIFAGVSFGDDAMSG